MPLKVKSNMALINSITIVVKVEISIKSISMKINSITSKNQRLSRQIKVDNKINSLYLCPKINRTITIPGINTIPMNRLDWIVTTNINSSNTMKIELDLLDNIINMKNKTIKKQSNLTTIARNMSLKCKFSLMDQIININSTININSSTTTKILSIRSSPDKMYYSRHLQMIIILHQTSSSINTEWFKTLTNLYNNKDMGMKLIAVISIMMVVKCSRFHLCILVRLHFSLNKLAHSSIRILLSRGILINITD